MSELSYEERYELYKENLLVQKENFKAEMQRKETLRRKRNAAKECNKNLFCYWVEQLNNSVSKKRREQVVSALMFGNTERYKGVVR